MGFIIRRSITFVPLAAGIDMADKICSDLYFISY